MLGSGITSEDCSNGNDNGRCRESPRKGRGARARGGRLSNCAESVAMLLRMYGHSVEIARNGPVALQAVRDRPPDVVLVDIGLPGMDGWKVAKWIREQVSEKKQLLIAVTGFGEESDRQHSKESGIDLHLTKPVNPEELEVVLRSFQRIVAEDAVALTFEADGRSPDGRAGPDHAAGYASRLPARFAASSRLLAGARPAFKLFSGSNSSRCFLRRADNATR